MSLLLELIIIPVVFLALGSIIVFGILHVIARLFLKEYGPYTFIEDYVDDEFISITNALQDFNKFDKYE